MELDVQGGDSNHDVAVVVGSKKEDPVFGRLDCNDNTPVLLPTISPTQVLLIVLTQTNYINIYINSRGLAPPPPPPRTSLMT